ncbi:MAG: tetraacyldisaccharide 4'-kinase, partial [Alphaproteobacteria bacterium]|nr:tetraacyldisaccharide 4'-kinase [Alphaproteobacteria bacterium]
APLSWFYRGATFIHQSLSKPYRASVPVISIGNFVLGGAGKTPLTIAVAKKLQTMGHTPHIISRGYGGSLSGPLQVDLDHHIFQQVGDEPLLLAKVAPTWVSRNRRAAVDLAIKAGADILLLDDAHQNHTIHKDVQIVVVNASQGFGNGCIFPAGPLRQSISSGLKNTSALVFVSDDKDPLPATLSPLPCPLIRAKIVPLDLEPIAVIGFAGIGYPDKFRQTLQTAGYNVKGFVTFPDHHPYTEEDLRKLRMRARVERASLITTEKDMLRIPAPCRAEVLTLPIGMKFQPRTALEDLLKQVLGTYFIS